MGVALASMPSVSQLNPSSQKALLPAPLFFFNLFMGTGALRSKAQAY